MRQSSRGARSAARWRRQSSCRTRSALRCWPRPARPSQSLELVALLSAAILIATAIVAAARLRSVKPANPVEERSSI